MQTVVTDTHTVVSGVQHDVADTHVVVSEIQRDVADTHTMVSEIRYEMLGSQKGPDDQHRLVSDTWTRLPSMRAHCRPESNEVSNPDHQ